MLTKKDAIVVGKAIVRAATAAKYAHWNDPQACYVINGSLHYTLNNIWDDVLPERIKAAFGWDCQKFIDEVWK